MDQRLSRFQTIVNVFWRNCKAQNIYRLSVKFVRRAPSIYNSIKSIANDETLSLTLTRVASSIGVCDLSVVIGYSK
jgi:hypothetical protein